ncbi:MAG: hypothetical protein V1663_03865 [archaeon]
MKKIKNNLLKNILFAFLIIIVILVVYFFLVLDVRSFKMHIKVGNNAGFNLSDQLEFGIVYPDTSASKKIFVQNTDYEKTRVVIKAYGDLKDWVIVSENNFVMNKGEFKNLRVEVLAPEDAEYKDYYGELRIIFLRF